ADRPRCWWPSGLRVAAARRGPVRQRRRRVHGVRVLAGLQRLVQPAAGPRPLLWSGPSDPRRRGARVLRLVLEPGDRPDAVASGWLARRPLSQDRFFLKETVQWHVYR